MNPFTKLNVRTTKLLNLHTLQRISILVLVQLSLIFLVSPSAFAKYQIAPTQNESNNNENRALLQRISKAVTDIASESSKALVYVSIVKTVRGAQGINPFEFFFGPGGPQFPQIPEERTQSGIGSGFFIDLDKGYILTNNHVVEGAD
jgi:S1-C subfamily serine protease